MHLNRIVHKCQFSLAPEILPKSVHQYNWAQLPVFPQEKISKGMRQLRDFIPELFVQLNVFSLHGADLTEVQYCKVCTGLRLHGRYTSLSLIGGDKESKSRSFPTATLRQQLLPLPYLKCQPRKGREYGK